MKSEISSACPCGNSSHLEFGRPVCGVCYFSAPQHLRHTFEFRGPKRRAQAESALREFARTRISREHRFNASTL